MRTYQETERQVVDGIAQDGFLDEQNIAAGLDDGLDQLRDVGTLLRKQQDRNKTSKTTHEL